MSDNMYCVGIIGQAGSGKSTATQFFRRYGIPCISADDINHHLLLPGTPTYQRIVAHFGQHILNPDQTIHKPYLRHLISTDRKAKEKLEGILHPEIETEILHQIKILEKNDNISYCVIELPLLYKRPDYLHRILWIDADQNQRVKRIAARDQCTLQEAKNLMHVQPALEIYKKLAHDQLKNNTSLPEFAKKIKTLHDQYLTQSNTLKKHNDG